MSLLYMYESESESCSILSSSLWPHGLYSPQNSPGQNTGEGSLSLLKGIFSTQGSNWDLLHCRQILYHLSYQGSSVKVTQSCLTLCNPMDCTVHGILQARILEWAAFPFLQGIFPTQGSNPRIPHCRQILYQLSHKASPRILEWVADPFSNRSSWPRNQTRVSCIAWGFFTNWATREAQEYNIIDNN